MLSLKAEIEKKEREYNRKRAQNGGSSINKMPSLPKKPKSFSSKNKGVEMRNKKDKLEMSMDEVDKHQKSREILEAKSKLYDKMTSGEVILDSQSSEMFLVDFEQKSLDAWRDKREKGISASQPAIDVNLKDLVKSEKADKSKGDEWVEYVDVLGRTRSCKKSELEKLQKIDEKLKPNQEESPHQSQSSFFDREPDNDDGGLKKDEMFYEDFRDSEVRELGVGYFKFSQDGATRKEEMRRLEELRRETVDAKKKHKEEKKNEQNALRARLEKIRLRKIEKLKKLGKKIPAKLLKPIEIKEETNDDEEKPVEIKTNISVGDILKPAKTTGSNEVREWDKNKTETLWLPAQPKKAPITWQNPRETRDSSFAPPSSYYQHPKSKTAKIDGEKSAPNISDHDRMVRLLESVEAEKRAASDEKVAEEERVKREKGEKMKQEREREQLYVPAENPVKISVKSAPKKQNLVLKKSDLFDE